MQSPTSLRTLAPALAISLVVAACSGGDTSGPTPTATVQGVVTDTAGTAIQGASVSIGSATATTGANGAFELRNLPVGTATIVASAPGFDARSENVSLIEGSNTRDVVLTPTPTAAVSGAVTAAGGAAIEGASVSIGSASATTDVDGRFEIPNLPVGSATITTSAPLFDQRSDVVTLVAGANTHDVVLTPQPTASLTGVVRDSTGAIIAGASLSVGGATATTGADGAYALQNLSIGTWTMGASAPRFDTKYVSISLAEGANAHDVVLSHQTAFTSGNVVAHLPTGVAEYEAAIVFLPGLMDPSTGLPLDSRGLVLGTIEQACRIWCGSDKMDVRTRALELVGGNVALIGTTTLTDNPTNYETLLQALGQFGTQSLHPELATIPILFVGHSMGGCTAYGFSRVHGDRVAGFMTMKGGCHNPGPVQAAAAVPGYFLIGGQDAQYRAENITGVFEAGRSGDAPWTISIDAFGHSPIFDFDGMFDWIDAVLTARLPETSGEPLRPMTETAGWLGDRSNGSISTHACYGSDRSNASWLPSEETALDWQRMAGGTVVVEAC